MLTLYNEAPYSQTIQAGTVLTGADGIQVATDQTVTIAAGSGAVNGSAMVSAHTIQAGERANIPAYDMNSLCCVSGILAKNTTSFTGGVDPKAYLFLSQTDLDRQAQHLAGILSPGATAAIHNQMRASEQFLQPMQCNRHTSSTPNVGERATIATISVSETCNAHVYDYSTLQLMTRSQFLQDAGKAGSFIPSGTLSMQLAKVAVLDSSHNTYQLTVSAQGTLQFHLTAFQTQQLTKHLAGKHLADAQRQLLQFAGVQGVYIKPVSGNDMSLPTDPNNIQIIVS